MNSGAARGQVARVRSLIRQANLLVEVRDARGPEITSPARYVGRAPVPRVLVLAKADLASPAATRGWLSWIEREPRAHGGDRVLALDLSGRGAARARAGRELLSTLEDHAGRVKSALGMVRAVVVGLPNVGKSTLINRMRRSSAARVGDQPGVTRGPMWVQVSPRVYVLDTPGIIQVSGELLSRAGDQAWKLSLLNVVPESAMEPEDTVTGLLGFLRRRCELVRDARLRRHLAGGESPEEILVALAHEQGARARGGGPDCITVARRLIGRFRRLELGRISLDEPPAASASRPALARADTEAAA
jgi:ribosome biogenesis GTPase A